MSDVPPPPKHPAAPAPVRPPGSLRRTSTIEVDWPEGRHGPMRLNGRARDLFTPQAGGAPVVCAEDAFEALLTPDRLILSIRAEPDRPAVQQLVGVRGGGHLRGALEEALPEERLAGTPLSLLLDDISGVSLIAGWAWTQWGPEWLEEVRRAKADPERAKEFDKVGVCTGLREGSSGLAFVSEGAATPDLRHPDDPEGWHAFARKDIINLRRARRMDLSCADGALHIDAAFQDSASTPAGARSALHEYRVAALADAGLRLVALEAEPRVLPFPECPAAAANVRRLVGRPMAELRAAVLEHLRGAAGCTHLNDALRALADAPQLAARLRATADA